MATLNPIINEDNYVAGQSLGDARINQNIDALCVLARAVILDIDLTAAPGSPQQYDAYIPAGTPAGGDPWEGKGNREWIAYHVGTSWYFMPLSEGYHFAVVDEKILKVVDSTGAIVDYTGTNWT